MSSRFLRDASLSFSAGTLGGIGILIMIVGFTPKLHTAVGFSILSFAVTFFIWGRTRE